MQWKIPLFKSYSTEDDVHSVAEVIRRGTYWATGPEIKEFEQKIADYIGKNYAITFNSGTSALHSLLLSHEITSGEVIVPSFTFIATANAVLLAGAKPVFADIENITLGLDASDVEKKITDETKAIMPIHYGGCTCKDIMKIKKIANKHNILLFEDAAQSLGSAIGDKKSGNFSDAAMFSLCQDKMITTGEGGIIVTDEKEVYEKLKLLRSHGRAESSDYFSSNELMDYVTLGYNFRMPTMNAALGLSQFKKITEIIEKRRNIAKLYNDSLSKMDGIYILNPPKEFFTVYQKYPIFVDKGKRDKLKNHLADDGIFSKPYFGEPVHLTQFYKKNPEYHDVNLPNTEKLSHQVLNLPIFPSMKNSEVKLVINSIKNFMDL